MHSAYSYMCLLDSQFFFSVGTCYMCNVLFNFVIDVYIQEEVGTRNIHV